MLKSQSVAQVTYGVVRCWFWLNLSRLLAVLMIMSSVVELGSQVFFFCVHVHTCLCVIQKPQHGPLAVIPASAFDPDVM